ncbi:hypothetical protein [uncultured Dialister sp.]|jgi:hypothetical protein|uniref:hypothetical protein n=4 Tax=Veillonellaceae TaxID=31977 RepID=UPI0025DC89AC|nr:hypothetical protein [uncultured Dialister sp.]
MIKKLFSKKAIIVILMLWVAYHILFGTIRMLVDLKYPNGSSSNTVVAFGMNLRSAIFSLPEGSDKWVLRDTQPEKQQPDVSGFRLTGLDENVYDYEIEMGLFYQYKMFYIYGRNGFWMIQADPFHIRLLRNQNIPARDAEKLDETIAKYNTNGNQFTVINDESGLTWEERKAYNRLKDKAQPRIAKLKEQGLYP